MNVIRFPRSRSLPPTPTIDALIGELAAVELELVRARLAQIRSETRQANVFWTWYWFKKCLFWGFALWLVLTFMNSAQAQTSTRSFYNERGSFAGSSVTRGNSSSFYDGQGRFAGSAVRHGKWMTFYDQ
jgi:hypothetical protein